MLPISEPFPSLRCDDIATATAMDVSHACSIPRNERRPSQNDRSRQFFVTSEGRVRAKIWTVQIRARPGINLIRSGKRFAFHRP